MNIVDPILFHCKSIPLAAAICAPGQNMGLISYGRLQQAINNVGKKGVAAGLKRGSIVAVTVEDRILNAAITLGLMRIGAITFEARGTRPVSGLKIDALITDRPFPGNAQNASTILVDRGWMAGDGEPLADQRHYQGSEDDLCRIVLTSGTTGEPKAVGISHKLLARRIARHHYMLGNQLSQSMRLHCDFSFGASLGIQFLIYMLWKGGTLFCGGGDIDTTIQTFDLYKVQALLGSPASLAGYTKFYELNKQAHSRFELAIAGGSQLHQSLSERARARFCTNVVAAYGATEISMIAAAPAHMIADVEGAVGYMMPDVTIEIVDDGGRPVAAGADGTVRILSPFNVDGYLGSAAGIESVFRDGYFYPGDLGHLTSNGLLVITGRAQAVMNIAGDKVKPEAIEAVLRTFSGIDDAAVAITKDEFGMDRICAAIVGASVDQQALNSFSTTVNVAGHDSSTTGGGGGQVGCNWQEQNLVYGIEGDATWLRAKTNILGFSDSDYWYHTPIDWLATVRGRVGITAGMNGATLLYLTGGVAFAGIKSGISFSDGTTDTTNHTQVGWTAGFGAERMITQHWTVKAEFLYVDLGKTNYTASDYNLNFTHELMLGKVGLNYKF